MAFLIGLAAFLNLYALGQNHWANTFYTAGVRSMTLNWHNFLYNSFDPSGVMTIDKTPLATWVEAASARIFGFNPWSILMPEALMGVATMVLVWDLTRRVWGRWPAFAAGLAFALTPIAVAMSRHNNPDALLVLCSVAALWCIVRAFDDRRTRWIVLAGVAVGLGFETKMAAALIVVPALAAAWFWVAPDGRRRAAAQLAGAGAATAVVGFAWPVFVALTPAADRPWISGTSDNSVWSLIFGYNGVGRIAGQAGGPQILVDNARLHDEVSSQVHLSVFGGTPGPFRLLNAYLGGQIGWLIGVAVVGAVGILISCRLRRDDPRTGWLIATGGIFAACVVTFSSAEGIFHTYYVSLLSPFIAALVGATLGECMTSSAVRARYLALAAIGAGALTELAVWHAAANLPWLPVVFAVVALPVAVAIVFAPSPVVRTGALVVALTVLLAAPGIWSFQTLGYPTAAIFPLGGPESARYGRAEPPGRTRARQLRKRAATVAHPRPLLLSPPVTRDDVTRAILIYAKHHGGGTVAVSNQLTVDQTIIRSASKAAGLGGFAGLESEVNASWLATMVRIGRIRWVYTDAYGVRALDGRIGSSRVMAQVRLACLRVNAQLPQVGSTATGKRRRKRVSLIAKNTALYDCAGRAPKLLAVRNRHIPIPVLAAPLGKPTKLYVTGYL